MTPEQTRQSQHAQPPPMPLASEETVELEGDTSDTAVALRNRDQTLYTPPSQKIHSIQVTSPIPGPLRKDTMQAVLQTLLDRFDPTGERQALIAKKNDALRVGQIVSVSTYNNYPDTSSHTVFSGYLIAIKRAGIETSIRLRTKLMRVGAEMRFPLYSPTIKEIKIVVAKPQKRIRRAKLYYMRKEEHDKGSVDGIIKAERERQESDAKLLNGQQRRALPSPKSKKAKQKLKAKALRQAKKGTVVNTSLVES